MDFIDDFIQEYKNNPCLWKANCVDFKNRTKRQEAYLRLIELAAKHGEHYNVERTKQKINNLRCAFRHQLKKYNELRNKTEKEDAYCPKRKYFESLMFLKDEEFYDKKNKNESADMRNDSIKVNLLADVEIPPDLSDKGIKKKHKYDDVQLKQCRDTKPISIEASSEGSVYVSGNELEDFNFCPNKSNDENSNGKENFKTAVANIDSVNLVSKERSSVRKRSSSVSSQVSTETELVSSKSTRTDVALDLEKILSLACKSIKGTVDDHYTNLGKVIAHKLRSMEHSQSIFAEKIIADVLFQGQMKMLSQSSVSQYSQFLKSISQNDMQL